MTSFYVALESELLVISDEGGHRSFETHLAGLHPRCLAADPNRPEHLYCGTFGEGLYESEDAGSSWRPAGEGIAHPRVTAVAVGSGEDNDTVYAGTEPSAVFRSEDAGEGWRELRGLTGLPSSAHWSFPPRPETHHVRYISVDPARPRLLYVCIEAGALVRSPDGGESWEDRRPDGPRDTHTLATHRKAPGRLYSAAGDGYFESHDYGESWSRPAEGLSRRYLWAVAVDADDPNTVVVSAAHGPWQAHNPESAESAIYRRTGDEPWQLCRKGLPEPEGTLAPVVAASEAHPGTFYAASNHGLYLSEDAGENWERLEDDWTGKHHPQRPHALVVVETA